MLTEFRKNHKFKSGLWQKMQLKEHASTNYTKNKLKRTSIKSSQLSRFVVLMKRYRQ